jgi:hypothetical protein
MLLIRLTSYVEFSEPFAVGSGSFMGSNRQRGKGYAALNSVLIPPSSCISQVYIFQVTCIFKTAEKCYIKPRCRCGAKVTWLLCMAGCSRKTFGEGF